MSGGPALAARSLEIARGRFCVRAERIAVDRGETLVLLGPNGAGKSTLLQALALVEPVASGEIYLAGNEVTSRPLHARRSVAVALQEPLLVQGSVRANVELGLRLHGVASEQRRVRAARWMERTGIGGLAGRDARRLSGGEQRRVSLARALALEPLVLFLDEPFSGLDAPARRALLEDLPDWLRAAGCATVLVTHDRDEAIRLGTHVAVMFDGEVRQQGLVADVFAMPGDEETATFLGIENILRGEIIHAGDGVARVRCGEAELFVASDLTEGAVTLVLDASDITLLEPRDDLRTSARNALDCTVMTLQTAGRRVTVRLDAGAPLVAIVTRSAAEDLALAPGGRVTASIKATAIHVLPATGDRRSPAPSSDHQL